MSWVDFEAKLAEGMGGSYDPRPEQAQLSGAIEDAFSDRAVLLAEAPTGTGKSLAGLLPAIEHAKRVKMPVVISTGTKALQAQYLGKDLPFLAENAGVDFTFTMLKGRGNYVCMAKADGPIKEGQYPGLKEELFAEGATGDFDFLNSVPVEAKPSLTTTSEECPGANECPFGSVCFADRARERARQSEVVVVNHALLSLHAAMSQPRENEEGDTVYGPGLLGDFSAVVVDEAHGLEDYATGALGDEISERSISDYADAATRFLHKAAKQDAFDPKGGDRVSVALKEAAEALFGRVQALLRENSVTELALTDSIVFDWEDELVEVVSQLAAMHDEVMKARTQMQRDDMIIDRKRVTKRGQSLRSKITALVPHDETNPPIRWVELRENKTGSAPPRPLIKHAPLNIGPLLRAGLWEQVASATLMSATLSVDGDFAYIRERLGIPTSAREFRCPSPFDYDEQSAIYVPEKAVPAGSDKGSWENQLNNIIPDLVTAADGRSLLLFTSRASMRATWDEIADELIDRGFTPIIQDAQRGGQLGSSVPRLIEAKRNDPSTVLFALKSFMEGVDIPGDALQLVIIDKMPFPNFKDIIFAARAEALNTLHNDKWASFSRMSVPMMSLVLQQAVGRLIRTKLDRGLIVIMDSRLHPSKGNRNSKGYGRTVFKSLHAGRFITSHKEARSYLQSLAGNRIRNAAAVGA